MDRGVRETAAAAPDPIPDEELCRMLPPDERGIAVMGILAFNTAVEISVVVDGAPAETVHRAFAAVRDDCRLYERLFSRTLPHSDIGRLNAAGSAPVAVDARTAEVLRAAQRFCADSEGTFDVTVGVYFRLWDFHQGIVPRPADLQRASAHVDWRGLRVQQRSTGWYASLEDPEAALDLGGIAKGWIADRLTERLAGWGFKSFVVNLGGNVAVLGQRPEGGPWKVGIRHPSDSARIAGLVPLAQGSAVTSGIYERCFTGPDGRLHHHILDPRTGLPVETDAAAVTAVADTSLAAEGYSTTLLALGTRNGLDFAAEHPDLKHVIYIDEKGNVLARWDR